MDKWYYEQDGVELGPCTASELHFLSARGKLTAATLVRREGTDLRQPAGEVEPIFRGLSTAAAKVPVGPMMKFRRPGDPAPEPNPPGSPPPVPTRLPKPVRQTPRMSGAGALTLDGDPDELFRRRVKIATVITAVFVFLLILLLWFLIGEPIGLGGAGDGDGIAAVDGGGGTGGGSGGGEGTGTGDGQGSGSGGGAGSGSGGGFGSTDGAGTTQMPGTPGAPIPDPSSTRPAPRPRVTGSPRPIPTGISLMPLDAEPAVIPTTAPAAAPDSFGGGSGGGGGGGTGDFFGIRASGNRFVYVVDCSGSMQGGGFAKACEELITQISKLRTSQQFFVIFFDNRPYPQFDPDVTKTMLPATKPNVEKLHRWVSGFRGGGGTEPRDALLMALELKPSAIFFLTDGAFNPAVVQELKQVNKKPIPINAISFLNTYAEPILKQIAADSGGTYKFVP